jgi:hypothetical protein
MGKYGPGPWSSLHHVHFVGQRSRTVDDITTELVNSEWPQRAGETEQSSRLTLESRNKTGLFVQAGRWSEHLALRYRDAKRSPDFQTVEPLLRWTLSRLIAGRHANAVPP